MAHPASVAGGNFDPHEILQSLPDLGEVPTLPEGFPNTFANALLLSYQRNQELTIRVNELLLATGRLENKVADLQSNQRNDFEELTRLRARLNEIDNEEPIEVPKTQRDPKIGEPEEFHGERSKFTMFQSQLMAFFAAHIPLKMYTTDVEKFRYATSRIRGNAYNHVMLWVDSQLSENPAEEVNNFSKFLTGLARAFGPIDARGEAITKMSLLKHTTSIDAYANAYRIVMHQTGYNEDMIIRSFDKGLKPILKNYLPGIEQKSTFEERVSQIAELESRVTQLKNDAVVFNTFTPKAPSSTSTTTPRRNPDAMDVDRLSTEELARRRKIGQCFTPKCDSKEHMTKDCPLRKNKTRVATTRTPEPSASIEEISERALVPASASSLEQANAEGIASMNAQLADLIRLMKNQKGAGF